MAENKYNWLPHLRGSIPEGVHSYTLSMYSVALEGWRRGLTLKFINSRRSKAHTLFALSNNNKQHIFSVSRGDYVPRQSIRICINKNITKEYLLKADVPTPKGKNFDETVSTDEIVSYTHKLQYPLVIKPTDGTGGKGVIANIKSESHFKKALAYVRDTLNFKNVIVEEHFVGEDYRLYVIDSKVIGAIKRMPANVIGDGINTVKELLRIKNAQRIKNPALFNRPIKIDQEMKDMLSSIGYDLDSIPKRDEMIFLKSKNNVSVGGDSVDATDELSDKIKQIAIDASNAIPGLVQCGVDIMVNQDLNRGVVIEINSRPHITAQIFPYKGIARDIPRAIIDYYFPETKANHSNPLYYFDFNRVWDSFKNGLSKEINIPNHPEGELNATRFIVSGQIQHDYYGQWIKEYADSLNLNGYIKFNNNENANVIISGKLEAINEFRYILKNESPKNIYIHQVTESKRKTPVKIGFEIVNIKKAKTASAGSSHQHLSDSPINVKKEYRNNDIKELEYYKKEYFKVMNSTSWKLTKPIRIIGRMFR